MDELLKWLPAITVVVTAIWTASQIVGRVKDQEKQGKEHHDWLVRHDGEIEELTATQRESKAWREGYNAANVKHTGKPSQSA